MTKPKNLSDLIQRQIDKQHKAQQANRDAIARAQERIAAVRAKSIGSLTMDDVDEHADATNRLRGYLIAPDKEIDG